MQATADPGGQHNKHGADWQPTTLAERAHTRNTGAQRSHGQHTWSRVLGGALQLRELTSKLQHRYTPLYEVSGMPCSPEAAPQTNPNPNNQALSLARIHQIRILSHTLLNVQFLRSFILRWASGSYYFGSLFDLCSFGVLNFISKILALCCRWVRSQAEPPSVG